MNKNRKAEKIKQINKQKLTKGQTSRWAIKKQNKTYKTKTNIQANKETKMQTNERLKKKHVYMGVNVYVYLCVCVYVFICVYLYVYVYVCIFMYVCYMYVNI